MVVFQKKLNKKVIVCRKVTERPESLGTHSFICNGPPELEPLFYDVIRNYKTDAPCPYGDGHSSDRIVKVLEEIFNV